MGSPLSRIAFSPQQTRMNIVARKQKYFATSRTRINSNGNCMRTPADVHTHLVNSYVYRIGCDHTCRLGFTSHGDLLSPKLSLLVWKFAFCCGHHAGLTGKLGRWVRNKQQQSAVHTHTQTLEIRSHFHMRCVKSNFHPKERPTRRLCTCCAKSPPQVERVYR